MFFLHAIYISIEVHDPRGERITKLEPLAECGNPSRYILRLLRFGMDEVWSPGPNREPTWIRWENGLLVIRLPLHRWLYGKGDPQNHWTGDLQQCIETLVEVIFGRDYTVQIAYLHRLSFHAKTPSLREIETRVFANDPSRRGREKLEKFHVNLEWSPGERPCGEAYLAEEPNGFLWHQLELLPEWEKRLPK